MARLAPPRVRPGIVERGRIFRRLETGWSASLTLVVAPAGYGKSVAAKGWLAHHGHPAAWVTTDAGDNDPVRLWTSIATAVEQVRASCGKEALDRLRSPLGAVRPAIEALAAALATDGRPLALVLDDLHEIADPGSLDHAIELLPDNVLLLLLTRAPPALRVARLRSQGLLVEIGANELALTGPEARRLLDALDVPPLDEGELATLIARTGGWPAVVYLAGLWLRQAGNRSVQAFRGSQRAISDYLAREVLSGFDPETERFLRRSCVLTELSGEACDAILETTGSQARLNALERSNLLVTEAAERPGWFRCHPLLRDAVLDAFVHTDPAAVAVLRQRALAWSRAHGLIEDAADYAVASADWDALAGLTGEHQFALLSTGRGATLARWTAAMPRRTLLARPATVAAAIAASYAVGRPAPEVRRLLAIAREHPSTTDYDTTIVRIAMALYRDDHVGEALALAEAAADTSGDQLRVSALATLALLALVAGDAERATATARAAFEHPDAGERPNGLLIACAVLAILEARAGRVFGARGHADRALACSAAFDLGGRAPGALAEIADALTSALEGRLGHAERRAVQAAATTIDGGLWQAWMLLELGAIRLQRGLLPAAARSLAHADELLATARDAGSLPAMAADVRRALDRAGTRAVAPPAEPPSPAEVAVLRLLSDHSIAEIARALYLSPNTVKSHIRALYRKLDVNTREAAVTRAVALGLIEDPTA